MYLTPLLLVMALLTCRDTDEGIQEDTHDDSTGRQHVEYKPYEPADVTESSYELQAIAKTDTSKPYSTCLAAIAETEEAHTVVAASKPAGTSQKDHITFAAQKQQQYSHFAGQHQQVGQNMT